MASFVEQATLKVVDQSTGPIKKINAALKQLFATAKSLKSTKIDLAVNDKGLAKANAAVRQLSQGLRGLKAVSKISLTVDTKGLSKAQAQIKALHRAAAKPVAVSMAAQSGGRAARSGASRGTGSTAAPGSRAAAATRAAHTAAATRATARPSATRGIGSTAGVRAAPPGRAPAQSAAHAAAQRRARVQGDPSFPSMRPAIGTRTTEAAKMARKRRLETAPELPTYRQPAGTRTAEAMRAAKRRPAPAQAAAAPPSFPAFRQAPGAASAAATRAAQRRGGPPRGPAPPGEPGARRRPRHESVTSRLGKEIGHDLIRGGIHRAIGSAGQAARVGTTTADVAETQMRLQQLKPAQQAEATRILHEIARQKQGQVGGPIYSPSQRQQLFTESLGTTGGELGPAGYLTSKTEELTRLGVSMGQSFEEAERQALNFIKGSEARGAFTDRRTGKFSTEKADTEFDLLRRLKVQIGREFTGESWRQLNVQLGSARFPAGHRMIETAALLQEEEKTRVIEGMQQLVKQLSGRATTKGAKKGQEAFGLVDASGKKRVAAEDIGRDIGKYVDEQIIPRMKERGMDPTDPEHGARWAQQVAAQIVSHQKAQAALQTLILKSAQITRHREQMSRRDTSEPAVRAAQEGNITTAVHGFGNALSDAFGQAVKTIGPQINAVLQEGTRAATETAQALKDKTKTSAATGAELAGVGALGAGIASGFLTAAGGGMTALGATAGGAFLTGLGAFAGGGAIGLLATAIGAGAAAAFESETYKRSKLAEAARKAAPGYGAAAGGAEPDMAALSRERAPQGPVAGVKPTEFDQPRGSLYEATPTGFDQVASRAQQKAAEKAYRRQKAREVAFPPPRPSDLAQPTEIKSPSVEIKSPSPVEIKAPQPAAELARPAPTPTTPAAAAGAEIQAPGATINAPDAKVEAAKSDITTPTTAPAAPTAPEGGGLPVTTPLTDSILGWLKSLVTVGGAEAKTGRPINAPGANIDTGGTKQPAGDWPTRAGGFFDKDDQFKRHWPAGKPPGEGGGAIDAPGSTINAPDSKVESPASEGTKMAAAGGPTASDASKAAPTADLSAQIAQLAQATSSFSTSFTAGAAQLTNAATGIQAGAEKLGSSATALQTGVQAAGTAIETGAQSLTTAGQGMAQALQTGGQAMTQAIQTGAQALTNAGQGMTQALQTGGQAMTQAIQTGAQALAQSGQTMSTALQQGAQAAAQSFQQASTAIAQSGQTAAQAIQTGAQALTQGGQAAANSISQAAGTIREGAAAAAQSFQQASSAIAQGGQAAASSLQQGASAVAQSGQTAAAALQQGASAVAASGGQAAAALQGAAPGIGASIGSAAASAISAKVGALSISVNAKVVGGAAGSDTGSQKAAD